MKTVKRSAVETFSKRTKKAAADVELSMKDAFMSVLNNLDCIFLVKEQSTVLKAFHKKKDVCCSSNMTWQNINIPAHNT